MNDPEFRTKRRRGNTRKRFLMQVLFDTQEHSLGLVNRYSGRTINLGLVGHLGPSRCCEQSPESPGGLGAAIQIQHQPNLQPCLPLNKHSFDRSWAYASLRITPLA